MLVTSLATSVHLCFFYRNQVPEMSALFRRSKRKRTSECALVQFTIFLLTQCFIRHTQTVSVLSMVPQDSSTGASYPESFWGLQPDVRPADHPTSCTHCHATPEVHKPCFSQDQHQVSSTSVESSTQIMASGWSVYCLIRCLQPLVRVFQQALDWIGMCHCLFTLKFLSSKGPGWPGFEPFCRLRSRSQSAGRKSSPGAARSRSSPSAGRTAVPPQRRVGTSQHGSLSSRLGLHRPGESTLQFKTCRRGPETHSQMCMYN